MSDLIDRQAAIDAVKDAVIKDEQQYAEDALKALPAAQPEQPPEIQDILNYLDTVLHPIVSPEHWDVYSELHDMVSSLPSAQPEPTQIISETRAIPSDDDCVSLSEKVTATYYDEEHEEWSRENVTVRDVLDSVCDEYTVLPSAQPEITHCAECIHWKHSAARKSYCEVFDWMSKAEDFCSFAERRTDE